VSGQKKKKETGDPKAARPIYDNLRTIFAASSRFSSVGVLSQRWSDKALTMFRMAQRG